MSYKADTVYESKALKKEVVSAFLSVFTERGLSETSVRDLSFSITQNSGGLYTYFKSNEANYRGDKVPSVEVGIGVIANQLD